MKRQCSGKFCSCYWNSSNLLSLCKKNLKILLVSRKQLISIQRNEKFTDTRNKAIRATLEAGEMPDGVTGLIPDGSTKVAWRWMGDIFEDDAQDVLNNSIVVRNLQELGVDSIEALKYLFPSKTDEERAAMLTGYPFRMVQATQQSINTFISLLGSLYQLPHPQTPELPLASDPNLDITGFLYRSLEFLRKELSYSGKYHPDSSDEQPPSLSPADERRAATGRPVRDQPRPSIPGLTGPGFTPGSGLPGTGPGPAGFGSGSQPMAAGIPGAQRQFEYKQPLPGPGTTLGVPDNSDSATNYTSQLGFNAPGSSSSSPVFHPCLPSMAMMQQVAAQAPVHRSQAPGI